MTMKKNTYKILHELQNKYVSSSETLTLRTDVFKQNQIRVQITVKAEVLEQV